MANLDKLIAELTQERDRISEVISNLERIRLEEPAEPAGRRGRKSMAPEERLVVSDRMRKYWAGRRVAARWGGG